MMHCTHLFPLITVKVIAGVVRIQHHNEVPGHFICRKPRTNTGSPALLSEDRSLKLLLRLTGALSLSDTFIVSTMYTNTHLRSISPCYVLIYSINDSWWKIASWWRRYFDSWLRMSTLFSSWLSNCGHLRFVLRSVISVGVSIRRHAWLKDDLVNLPGSELRRWHHSGRLMSLKAHADEDSTKQP